jgi:hypothetical protein
MKGVSDKKKKYIYIYTKFVFVSIGCQEDHNKSEINKIGTLLYVMDHY